MIGSETFIIVALRCTENSTPSGLARAICSVRKRRSAATPMKVPSTTSPARTGQLALSTVACRRRGVLDRAASWARRSTTDFSLAKKSRSPMVATFVFESGLQAPIRVRVLPRVVLDRGRGPAVGVALAQHGVDRGALDLVVAGPDLPLLLGRRALGVVGQREALRLQLRDRRLELGDRGGDVGQLDDVGLGPGGGSPSSASASGALVVGSGRRTARGCGRPGRCPGSRRRRRPWRRTPGRSAARSTSPAAAPRRCGCR